MRRARLRYCRGGNPYLIALQREARRYFRTTWEGVGAIPCVVIMTVFLCVLILIPGLGAGLPHAGLVEMGMETVRRDY